MKTDFWRRDSSIVGLCLKTDMYRFPMIGQKIKLREICWEIL